MKEGLSKTEGQIVRDNVFTFFNLLFFLLTLCLPAVGAYTDMLFFGIIIVNALIGGLLIGVPSFLLTLEPSYERIQGRFLRNILVKALPGGLVNGLLILLFLCWPLTLPRFLAFTAAGPLFMGAVIFTVSCIKRQISRKREYRG